MQNEDMFDRLKDKFDGDEMAPSNDLWNKIAATPEFTEVTTSKWAWLKSSLKFIIPAVTAASITAGFFLYREAEQEAAVAEALRRLENVENSQKFSSDQKNSSSSENSTTKTYTTSNVNNSASTTSDQKENEVANHTTNSNDTSTTVSTDDNAVAESNTSASSKAIRANNIGAYEPSNLETFSSTSIKDETAPDLTNSGNSTSGENTSLVSPDKVSLANTEVSESKNDGEITSTSTINNSTATDVQDGESLTINEELSSNSTVTTSEDNNSSNNKGTEVLATTIDKEVDASTDMAKKEITSANTISEADVSAKNNSANSNPTNTEKIVPVTENQQRTIASTTKTSPTGDNSISTKNEVNLSNENKADLQEPGLISISPISATPISPVLETPKDHLVVTELTLNEEEKEEFATNPTTLDQKKNNADVGGLVGRIFSRNKDADKQEDTIETPESEEGSATIAENQNEETVEKDPALLEEEKKETADSLSKKDVAVTADSQNTQKANLLYNREIDITKGQETNNNNHSFILTLESAIYNPLVSVDGESYYEDFTEFELDYIDPIVSRSYGIQIGREFGKSMEAGVGFHSFTFQERLDFYMEYEEVTWETQFNFDDDDDFGDSLIIFDLDTSYVREDYSYQSKYNYISIPLYLKWRYESRVMEFNLMGGLTYNRLIKQNALLPYDFYAPGYPEISEMRDSDFATSLLGWQASAGFTGYLNERVGLGLHLKGNGMLGSLYKSNWGVNKKLMNIGASFQLVIKL